MVYEEATENNIVEEYLVAYKDVPMYYQVEQATVSIAFFFTKENYVGPVDQFVPSLHACVWHLPHSYLMVPFSAL